jgi:hypothetical protein
MKNKISIVLLILSFSFAAQAQTTNYQAYSVFVFGISKYMQWPEYSNNEFLIVVVGKSKAYDEMAKGLTGRVMNGKPVKVVQADDYASLNPQILYIPDGKSGMIDEVIKNTSGKPILIIGEREGLFKKGAGMSFIAIDDKLRIDFNNKELTSRQIKVSTQLHAFTHESI